MKPTKSQKQYIYKLCGYDTRTKEEMVQWVTDDNDKISTNDLTFDQANIIINQLGGHPEPLDNWGRFDRSKESHNKVLSTLIQIGWSCNHEKYGIIADIERLSRFLQHDKRAPVNKPLLKMNTKEVSKTIVALEGILKSKYR